MAEGEFTKEELDDYLKMQAKAIVLFSFRNTFLEDIHAGKQCPTCGDDLSYSHISDEQMKQLMIECVNNMYTYLKLQIESEEGWLNLLDWHTVQVQHWNEPVLDEKIYNMFKAGNPLAEISKRK